MLAELKVNNLVLIQSLTLCFDHGANILTGETGAGKSILAGALGLLRGGRAEKGLVRAGTTEASVEALFILEHPENLSHLFEEQGLVPADEIILRRTVSSSGRTRIYLNGSLITLSQLMAWGEELLAISSQHDQQTLTSPAHQLDFLDSFGKHSELLTHMAQSYREHETVLQKLSALETELSQGAERRELDEFQLAEISKIAPEPQEDEHLLEAKNLAKTGAKLANLLDSAISTLSRDADNILSKLDRCRGFIDKASLLDTSLGPISEILEQAAQDLADGSTGIERLIRNLDQGESDMEEIDDRLNDLAKLKRKYGPTLDEVLARAEKIKASISHQETAGLDLALLKKTLAKTGIMVSESASALTESRKKAASHLAENLKKTLRVLGFPKIELKIEILSQDSNGHPGERIGPKGADQVNFLFCPNPGEGLKPLAKIASGGELSRLMLALKIAQESRSDQSLVFDEIDSGLGGATAEAVATKMTELAKRQQIFIITHLPQMAALAGRHFLAAKSPDTQEGRTVTTIYELSPDKRPLELARMLAGANPAPEALALAKALLGH